ncbi:glycine/betaine ABC transporter ATP-binding protein [Gordoniibacillus kamchatkensis]|uniref:Glycine/betaine ABC transporter ATP-binding protein n=1 Tax=Gordoniibacillus kamchatkensis TaxID=1590651 RepID=A0ABR5AJ06_9BACL|nr:ABC transporter ATP-binding protein [Paenibacillus sp. VKM B-2647]KIL40897.1 glycine/betaine ABC transporter ATP-binding protein [Paenibacillus sp. VKM B-2647]
MIVFDNATKIYESADKKVKAVDRINLHVEEGQICVFLGPSGCGKTTLLRMVNRLIPLSGGAIHVNGKSIESFDTIELRRSIGYVIQQIGLFPNMTIEQNICVVPKLLGWDRKKMQNRYDELMELMGLNPDEYRKRYPWELSGGQQQRIGVARALAADPPVMLMDEPFGALDPIMRERIQNEFLRIQQNVKKTILFVSHDIDEAIRLGDKIAIFKAGQLMQYGTPDEILSNPKDEFVEDFVGGDRALKRLTLLTVHDLFFKLKHPRKLNGDARHSGSPTIDMETNLRTALSVILSSPTGEAVVADSKNNHVGLLNLHDFEALADIHPFELKSSV